MSTATNYVGYKMVTNTERMGGFHHPSPYLLGGILIVVVILTFILVLTSEP